MTVRGLFIAAALLASAPAYAPSSARAACRLHAIWHYPWPQGCRTGPHAREMARGPQAPSRRVALLVTPTVGTQGSSAIIVTPAGPTLEPMPALGPVEAVEASGETRARLLLRAALEDADGH
jgi:hypothetical protein